MNAKEYLLQVRRLEKKIQILNDEIAELEERARGYYHSLSDIRVKTSKKNTTEDRLIALVEAKKTLNALVDTYVRRRTEIMQAAYKYFDEPLEVSIIQKYYFDGMLWTQLAEAEYVDITTLFRHNKKMLIRVDELLAEGKLK